MQSIRVDQCGLYDRCNPQLPYLLPLTLYEPCLGLRTATHPNPTHHFSSAVGARALSTRTSMHRSPFAYPKSTFHF